MQTLFRLLQLQLEQSEHCLHFLLRLVGWLVVLGLTALSDSISVYIGRGWSGGAKVLGKLPVPGRPTIWIQ